jgi:hypothetical protein
MSPQRSGGSVIYRLNYDLQKDFEPIGMMSINPQFMVAKKRPETAASVCRNRRPAPSHGAAADWVMKPKRSIAAPHPTAQPR